MMNTAVYPTKRTPFYLFAAAALFLAALFEIYCFFTQTMDLIENFNVYTEHGISFSVLLNVIGFFVSLVAYVIMPICLILNKTNGLLFKITVCAYVGIKVPIAIYYMTDLVSFLIEELSLKYFAKTTMYLFLVSSEVFLLLTVLLSSKLKAVLTFLPGGLMFIAACFKIFNYVLYLDELSDFGIDISQMSVDYYLADVVGIIVSFIVAFAYVFIAIHLLTSADSAEEQLN